jgi:hypothetical protein
VSSAIDECVPKVKANPLNDVGKLTAGTGVRNMVKPHDVILPNVTGGHESTPGSGLTIVGRVEVCTFWGTSIN